MHHIKYLFIVVFFIQNIFVLSQVPNVGNPIGKDVEINDSSQLIKLESKNFMFTPYVAPSYSPEFEMLFSGGGLISFKVQQDNPLLERSSIPFAAGYSTNGSTTISALPYIYGKNDSYRLTAKFYYKNMPDNYWGVGYASGDRTSKFDSTTRYHRLWWSLEGSVVKKISKFIFVGLSYDINRTNASSLNPYMKNDQDIAEFGSKIFNFGLGAVVELDHRDNAQNAYKGYLLSVSLLDYNWIFNTSNNNFAKLTFDARKYFPLWNRKTLAMQLKTQYADGKVPWSDLPQLGTQFDLRGYQWGRFRDKSSLFGIVEYRHMFSRRTVNKKGNFNSSAGAVLWTGVGTVASSYSEMSKWLFNFGVGFRYEIQPRMNVRIDYGFAKDNSGLYILFSEAF